MRKITGKQKHRLRERQENGTVMDVPRHVKIAFRLQPVCEVEQAGSSRTWSLGKSRYLDQSDGIYIADKPHYNCKLRFTSKTFPDQGSKKKPPRQEEHVDKTKKTKLIANITNITGKL